MSAPAAFFDRRHSFIAAENTAAIGCFGLSPSRSNSSSRLPPDQNRSSNAVASRLALRRLTTFSNTTAHTQTLAASRPIITSLTTKFASTNSPQSEKSVPAATRLAASTVEFTCYVPFFTVVAHLRMAQFGQVA